ncbi:hypothetical protein BGZ98_004859 [Dissophora globulifera]|nr:hypothetical protein BGZ98_004859 [Dissophora globulifera]
MVPVRLLPVSHEEIVTLLRALSGGNGSNAIASNGVVARVEQSSLLSEPFSPSTPASDVSSSLYGSVLLQDNIRAHDKLGHQQQQQQNNSSYHTRQHVSPGSPRSTYAINVSRYLDRPDASDSVFQRYSDGRNRVEGGFSQTDAHEHSAPTSLDPRAWPRLSSLEEGTFSKGPQDSSRRDTRPSTSTSFMVTQQLPSLDSPAPVLGEASAVVAFFAAPSDTQSSVTSAIEDSYIDQCHIAPITETADEDFDGLYMIDWDPPIVAIQITKRQDYMSLELDLPPRLPQPLLPAPASPRSNPAKKKSGSGVSGRLQDLEQMNPSHGANFYTLRKDGITVVLEQEDCVLMYDVPSQTQAELENPQFLYHPWQYLEPLTETDPLVNLRLVFGADQLPSGPEFANIAGPLRIRHMIDTYLIPHEMARAQRDGDVVFGLSGTLDRVCHGLQDFLKTTGATLDDDSFWEPHLLVPSRVMHLLIGARGELQIDSVEQYPADSTISCLRDVMGRGYKPIINAEQESVFSMRSTSLDTIMKAIRFVGQTLLENDDPLESCCDYYRGGEASIIPVREETE